MQAVFVKNHEKEQELAKRKRAIEEKEAQLMVREDEIDDKEK